MTFSLHRGHRPLLISMPHVGTQLPEALKPRLVERALAVEDTDWHLVAARRTEGPVPSPHLATDLDLDGEPELYGATQVWRTDSVGLTWEPACPSAR